MELAALELALKHERELRERLERRVERLEEKEGIRTFSLLGVGVLLGAGVEYLPTLLEIVK